MRLKHDFEGDNLQRKETAAHYVNFINKLQGNHTIALDAPWGSGKTKFIDFMSEKLDIDKDIYITYNAWDNDYTDEPFLSLMSEIFSSFEDKKYIGKDELKNIKSKAIAISKAFGKGVTKGLLKNIIGSDAVKDMSDGIEELAKGAISETSQLLIDSTFKNMSQTKKTREQFTTELKNTTRKILEEKNKNKLIIIIDELDRCKPTFAIELLENIKHLFAIDEIIFFIAVDKVQLAESIKAVYGSGFDADTYLHRFFDFDLYLKKSNLPNHYRRLLRNHLGSSINYQILIDFVRLFDLTIRDLERIISQTLLLETLNDENINIEICIILLTLKTKSPDIYNIIRTNTMEDMNEINKRIEKIIPSTDISMFWERMYSFIGENKNDSRFVLKYETYQLIKLIDTTQ